MLKRDEGPPEKPRLSERDLLGPGLDERVTTRNFRTRQKFGAASEVRKIEITPEMRANEKKP